MNLRIESSDLNKTYQELLKAQEEFAEMEPGEKISIRSYEVISRLLKLALVEINVKRLQYPK